MIKSYKKQISAFLSFLLCLGFTWSFAQIHTKIDRKHIKIGEPIVLSIHIPHNKNQNIQLPQIKDTLSYHIEILEQKTDSLSKNNELIHQIKITSFDSGDFLVRSLPVIINNDTLLTQSFAIKVEEVIIDSTNLIGYPIKPIMEEELSWKDYWNQYKNFILGVLLVFLILVLLYSLFIKKRKELHSSRKIKSPYEEANDSLKELDEQDYLNNLKYYSFYSDLSFILRKYLGRVYAFSSLELLSDDLIEYLKSKTDLRSKDIDNLKRFLHDSDLAKYAKTIPDKDKHNFYRNWAGELIERINAAEIETAMEYDLKANEENRKIE